MSQLKELWRDEGYEGGFVEWIEEWSQLGPGWNWRTFHPVMIEFEDDRSMGAVEATIIILGLGFRIRWNYAETEKVKSIKRNLEDLMDTESD